MAVEVPSSKAEAASWLRTVLSWRQPSGDESPPYDLLTQLGTPALLRGWAAIFFFAPGLHPDECDNPEGGWPIGWRPIAREVWRRYDKEEIQDDELYPAEAQCAGYCSCNEDDGHIVCTKYGVCVPDCTSECNLARQVVAKEESFPPGIFPRYFDT